MTSGFFDGSVRQLDHVESADPVLFAPRGSTINTEGGSSQHQQGGGGPVPLLWNALQETRSRQYQHNEVLH